MDIEWVIEYFECSFTKLVSLGRLLAWCMYVWYMSTENKYV